MYSKNLKQIRKELRYSIEKMADILEMPARTLGGYERGERTPSADFVSQLCKKLNVNANWYVTGCGEMFNSQNPKTTSSDKSPDFVLLNRDELAFMVREILKTEGILK